MSSQFPDEVVGFLQQVSQSYGSKTALLIKPGICYQRWTYSQIWEDTGRVASLLRSRGVKKGDRVLLRGPNCPQWILAFFGCLRGGAIVVPLDVRGGDDFVDGVISKTDPTLAITSRITNQGNQVGNVPTLELEDLGQIIRNSPSFSDVVIGPDDLAEIMFTSGTTGNPKGVMLTNRNLMANLKAASKRLPLKSSHRLLSILPLSHMFEQMGTLFMALHSGASITFATSRQPTILVRTMQECRPTTLLLVPQALELLMNGIEREVERKGHGKAWNLMLRAAHNSPFRLRRLLFSPVLKRFGGALDFIVCGGAALNSEVASKWELLGIKVLQGYGTTEASPVISMQTIDERGPDSVGRPLLGVELKIAGDGEILVKGSNITPGYWGDPSQTESIFDDGWYKTGDLGFLDKEGSLHLRGRKKDMIVLPDGRNVYAEDVEAVLKRHTAVEDVVVLGQGKDSGVEVHAVLLMNDPKASSEVISWANGLLDDHQQVRGFTIWSQEDFPRTHTLKVRKDKVSEALTGILLAPDERPRQRLNVRGEPVLHRLISEIRGIPVGDIGSDKSLGIDLKFDSLGRVELLSAIEEELGVYLDETKVESSTTVNQLQEMVGKGGQEITSVPCPQWSRRSWCRVLRDNIQRIFIFPGLSSLYRLRTQGHENLEGLQGPVIFASNHGLHLDNALILKAMPYRWRRRLAIAASDHMWRYPLYGIAIPLLANGFPLSRQGKVRASMVNLGRILDQGWSVLIYPEGRLTVGDSIQPFLGGTGLIAVEAGVPVVPLRLIVRRTGIPSYAPFIRQGDVELRFGQALNFSAKTPYHEAAQIIEHNVKAL